MDTLNDPANGIYSSRIIGTAGNKCFIIRFTSKPAVGFAPSQLLVIDSNLHKKVIYSWAATDSFGITQIFSRTKERTVIGDTLFFMTENTRFSEIWRTDGTKKGTFRLAHLRHNLPDSLPSVYLIGDRSLSILGRRLLFMFVNEKEMPIDGRNRKFCFYDLDTEEFGVLKSNIPISHQIDFPLPGKDLLIYNMHYRSAKDEWYLTDGTIAGTNRLKMPDAVSHYHSHTMTYHNDKLYFKYLNKTGDTTTICEMNPSNVEDTILTKLWRGTDFGGTARISSFKNHLVDPSSKFWLEINNGKPVLKKHGHYFLNDSEGVIQDRLQFSNGKYLSFHHTFVHGWEPWITDLTEAGSYLLVDTKPGSRSGGFAASNKAFGDIIIQENGYNVLYQTDGTRSGTHRLPLVGYPQPFEFPNGKLFRIDRGSNHYLYLFQKNGFTIKGLVFNDENGNGKHDKGEEGVFDQRIQIGPGNISVGTDNNGIISGYVKNQDCTAKLVVPKGWKLTSPNASYSLKKDSLNVVDLVWGIKPDKTLTDFDVDLAIGRRNCRRGKGGIYITNKGNQNITPTVDLKLDPSCTIKSANMAYTVGSDNVVTFKPKNIQSFVNRYISFEYSLSGVQGGDTVVHTLNTSFGSVSKSDDIEYVATCSYDPNDKQVNPIPTKGARGVKLNEGDELKYTIRFQNTGNDTAFDVTVYDTLDSKLDFESLRIVGSTHAMTHARSGDVVKFFFQNIELPDSTTDEPGSNGHLVFAIKPKAGYAHKTPIHNKAGIVFDVNKPIITNTVESNLLKSLPVKAATITFATYVSDKKVRVEWKDVAQNVDSLVLERSVNDTLNFSPIFETDQVVKFYEDAAVDKANDYYYRLRTFNPYEGAVSNMDTAKFVVGRGSIQNALNIYPNPADDLLTIEMPESEGPFHITLIDMTGKVVLLETANGSRKSIDVSQLTSGQYRVRIETNGKTYSDKIQIK